LPGSKSGLWIYMQILVTTILNEWYQLNLLIGWPERAAVCVFCTSQTFPNNSLSIWLAVVKFCNKFNWYHSSEWLLQVFAYKFTVQTYFQANFTLLIFLLNCPVDIFLQFLSDWIFWSICPVNTFRSVLSAQYDLLNFISRYFLAIFVQSIFCNKFWSIDIFFNFVRLLLFANFNVFQQMFSSRCFPTKILSSRYFATNFVWSIFLQIFVRLLFFANFDVFQ